MGSSKRLYYFQNTKSKILLLNWFFYYLLKSNIGLMKICKKNSMRFLNSEK